MIQKIIISAFFIPILLSAQQVGIKQEGRASYYGIQFHGRPTSSGENYDQNKFTAAHREFPFNTLVKVTNPANGKSVIVKVNDRGPHKKDRIIDVSLAAAQYLDIKRLGIAEVKLEVVATDTPLGAFSETASAPIESKQTPIKDSSKSNPDSETNPPSKAITLSSAQYSNKDGSNCKPSGFGVQVIAFKNKESVISTIELLETNGYSNIIIENVQTEGDSLYRIIIGPYSEISKVDNIIDKLIAEKFQPFLYYFP